MRLWPVVLVVLIGAYAVDHQRFDGRYFGALKTMAESILIYSR